MFSDKRPTRLPPNREQDFNIDLLTDPTTLKKEVYRMSDEELTDLRRQLDKLLQQGLVQQKAISWVLLYYSSQGNMGR